MIKHWVERLILIFTLVLNTVSGIEGDEIYEPEVARESIWLSQYDTEEWEISGYLGSYTFEGFDGQFLSGIKIAWHANSWFYLVANAGITTINETARENAGLPSLLDADSLEYFSLSAGINLIHGQMFIRREWAFESQLFLTAGIGRSIIDADPQNALGVRNNDLSTKNFSIGYRVFLSDWTTIYAEIEAHIVDFGLINPETSGENFSTLVGFSFFF